LSAGEGGKARALYRAERVREQESLDGVLDSARELVRLGRDFSYPAREWEEALGLDAEALNRAAQALLPTDHMLLVLVGDRATVLEQLVDSGLPTPVVVDLDGQPLDPR
jgi:hypothetical protein